MSWDPDVVKIQPDAVERELFDGEPRIRMETAAKRFGLGPREKEIRASGEIPFGMIVRPYTLQPGQAEIVAERLHAVLASNV